MALFDFREPPEEGGVEDLKRYISDLIEELNYVLGHIDEENMTDEFLRSVKNDE